MRLTHGDNWYVVCIVFIVLLIINYLSLSIATSGLSQKTTVFLFLYACFHLIDLIFVLFRFTFLSSIRYFTGSLFIITSAICSRFFSLKTAGIFPRLYFESWIVWLLCFIWGLHIKTLPWPCFANRYELDGKYVVSLI